MGTPKYVEIYEAMRAQCQELAAGERLPPERALATEFGVSLMTMRQALARLAERGWVRRSQGSGTFVTRPRVSMGPSLTSFTADMQARGLSTHSEVLRFEVVAPDLDAVRRLSLRAGEEVVVLERLRCADGEPMCHEISLFPSRLASILHGADLSQSAHRALAAHGVVPRTIERVVRAVAASAREGDLLDLPVNSPGLEVVDLFADEFGRTMQDARSLYRFDRYEVHSHLEAR